MVNGASGLRARVHDSATAAISVKMNRDTKAAARKVPPDIAAMLFEVTPLSYAFAGLSAGLTSTSSSTRAVSRRTVRVSSASSIREWP